MFCVRWQRPHGTVDCPSRTSTSLNELNSRFCRSYCYKCGPTGHSTKDCRNSSPRTLPTQQQSGGQSIGGTSTQERQIVCATQVLRRTEEKEAETGINTLEMKTGEKIKVLKELVWRQKLKIIFPRCQVRKRSKTWKFSEIADVMECLLKKS